MPCSGCNKRIIPRFCQTSYQFNTFWLFLSLFCTFYDSCTYTLSCATKKLPISVKLLHEWAANDEKKQKTMENGRIVQTRFSQNENFRVIRFLLWTLQLCKRRTPSVFAHLGKTRPATLKTNARPGGPDFSHWLRTITGRDGPLIRLPGRVLWGRVGF